MRRISIVKLKPERPMQSNKDVKVLNFEEAAAIKDSFAKRQNNENHLFTLRMRWFKL